MCINYFCDLIAKSKTVKSAKSNKYFQLLQRRDPGAITFKKNQIDKKPRAGPFHLQWKTDFPLLFAFAFRQMLARLYTGGSGAKEIPTDKIGCPLCL